MTPSARRTSALPSPRDPVDTVASKLADAAKVTSPPKPADPSRHEADAMTKVPPPSAAAVPAPAVPVLRSIEPPKPRAVVKTEAHQMTPEQRTVLIDSLEACGGAGPMALAEELRRDPTRKDLPEPSMFTSYDDSGKRRRYVKSKTVHHGNYGAFALIVDDEQRRLLAAKVFRGEGRRACDVAKIEARRADLESKRAKLSPEAFRAARRKTRLKTEFVSAREYEKEYAVLRKVRSPLQRLDQFKYKGRFVAISELMHADATDLFSSAMCPATRRALGRRMFAGVIRDLINAHNAKYVHLDLKLDNIFVDEDGEFVLGDYGLARRLEDGKATAFAGTPPYMAPEVVRYGEAGTAFTSKVDTYSLGFATAIALTGEDPLESISNCHAAQKQLWEWHRRMPRNSSGLLDLNALIPRDVAGRPDLAALRALTPFDQHMRTFCVRLLNIDPQLGAFTIQRLLTPVPKERANDATCGRFIIDLLNNEPEEDDDLATLAMKRSVAQSKRKDTEMIVASYVKAFFSSPEE